MTQAGIIHEQFGDWLSRTAYNWWPRIRTVAMALAALSIVGPIGALTVAGVGREDVSHAAMPNAVVVASVTAGICILLIGLLFDKRVDKEADRRREHRDEVLRKSVEGKKFVLTDVRLDILRRRGASDGVVSELRRMSRVHPTAVEGPHFVDDVKLRLGESRFADEIDLIVAVHDESIPIAILRATQPATA